MIRKGHASRTSFQPGQSGNPGGLPGGRPKGSRTLISLVRDLLNRTHNRFTPEIYQAMREVATNPKTHSSSRSSGPRLNEELTTQVASSQPDDPLQLERRRHEAQTAPGAMSGALTPVTRATHGPAGETVGRSHGARLVGCYFDSRAAECLERNARRQGQARVPDVAIYAAAKRFVVPTLAEGFDRLFRVNAIEASAFEVEEDRSSGLAPKSVYDRVLMTPWADTDGGAPPPR